MAEQSSNYNLKKPNENDFFNIVDFNNNIDIIDSEIKNANEKAEQAFLSASNGKAAIKAAITGMDPEVTIPTDVTFQQLAEAIEQIETGVDTEDATATTGQILGGQTAYVKGSKLTGTMADNGPTSAEIINLTSQNQEYTISAGFHSGLRKIKAVITNLAASVIKAGTTVGGILGTFTADATAVSGDMLSGKTAYVNGNKVTGNIPNYSVSHEQAIDTSLFGKVGRLYAKPKAGYYDGTQSYIYTDDPEFAAGNIKAGVNIFGVNGTLNPAEMLYNFPLSIQNAQPTAIREGHIWVKSSTVSSQVERVYIIDVPRATDQDNTLYLAVGNKASINSSYATAKYPQSGGALWFSDVNLSDAEATWKVSINTNGVTHYMAYRKPIAYSKIGGVLDIETAYMWNGSSWVLLSQKGQYLLTHTGLNIKTFNMVGETLTPAQTLPVSSHPYPIYDVSNDGTYYHTGSLIYKRNGDIFSLYSTLNSQVFGGVTFGNVDISCLSGDGLCLFDVKVALVSGYYKLCLCKYKNNGTTFVFDSFHQLFIANNYVPAYVVSDYSGSTVAIAYSYNTTPEKPLQVAVLFKDAGETYTVANSNIGALFQSYTLFWARIKLFFMSGRLIVWGQRESNAYGYARMMSFVINKTNKTVTYENNLETTGTASYDFISSICRVSDNHLLTYNIQAGNCLRLINVLNLGQSHTVSLSGYTIPQSGEGAGGTISADLNRNMIVLAPTQTDYILKFRLAISGTTATLTFLEKLTGAKINSAYTNVVFIPNKEND